MVQCWVRTPDEHNRAIAAVWADTVLDKMYDKTRLGEGKVHAASTAWAKQIQDDLDAVARLHCAFREWWDGHRRPLRLFDDGREVFLSIDCAEMRATAFTPDRRASTRSFKCRWLATCSTERDHVHNDGKQCASVFSSYMAMSTHSRTPQ